MTKTIALSLALVSTVFSCRALAQDHAPLACAAPHDTLTLSDTYHLKAQEALGEADSLLKIVASLALQRGDDDLAAIATFQRRQITVGLDLPGSSYGLPILHKSGFFLVLVLALLLFGGYLRRRFRHARFQNRLAEASGSYVEVPDFLNPRRTISVPVDALRERKDRPFYAIRLGNLTLVAKIYWRRVHF